jgi:large repetitive protein
MKKALLFLFVILAPLTACQAQQTATKTLPLTIAAAPITITTSSLPSATAGQQFRYTLQASGGTAPYSWSIPTQTAAAAITTAGLLTWTPGSGGTYSISAKVTDSSATPQTITKVFSLTVIGSTFTITTTSLPGGTVGTVYVGATMQASGGVAPFKWTATGLPAGLTLSTAGAISGTPTAAGAASVTFVVTDSTNATATLTIQWRAPEWAHDGVLLRLPPQDLFSAPRPEPSSRQPRH